jgi:protein phosphatase
MKINVPELSLVVMVGVSGSGKSTFARKHFKPTEIVSSDVCRGIVSDDENNQAASKDAFDLAYYIISTRLKNGLLTVMDATNVQPEARKALIKIAKDHHALPVAIVIDLPERVCHARNKLRPDRDFGDHVLGQQRAQLKKSLRWMKKEGFKSITVLKSEEEAYTITRGMRPVPSM